jgi:NAD(P)-dependent dehydrogenase (short-subunit alcohol dehydrogenase family)
MSLENNLENNLQNNLQNKVAIVVDGGQTQGETIGNGRATAILSAREGARVAIADRDLAPAEETVKLIVAEGYGAFAHELDVPVDEGLSVT